MIGFDLMQGRRPSGKNQAISKEVILPVAAKHDREEPFLLT
jgi:hypothetical protein